MRRIAPFLISLTLVVSACGSSSGRRDSWPGDDSERSTTPVSRERGTGEPVPLPLERNPDIPKSIPPDAPRSAEDMSGPAVQSLVLQARASLSANRPDQALATLERAQRIEPRNAFVWQMLATAHLAAGHMDQAENTAQKSNSLSRGNPYVEIENWKVIAAARQAAGDGTGALQAQSRVEELNRLLGR